VAVKLVDSHFGTVALGGLITIEVNAGAVTVKVALLEVWLPYKAVTVVLPCASEDATPLEFIVATPVFVDDQMTDPEISLETASEKLPVAVKVTGVPLGVDGVVGVMLIPVSVAVFTVRVAPGETMPLAEAVTVVLPTATPVATPVLLSMVATAILPVAHVTWLLISEVDASE
jgi:hypothetical protein